MEKTQEQEIDLKDLLFYILHKWRRILICTFLMIILVGGYKFGTLFQQQNSKEYITELNKQYNENIEKYQIEKDKYESTISSLTLNIENEELYQEKSILFQIDPNNKWVATADVFVKVGEDNSSPILMVDPTDSVIRAYAAAIIRGEYIEQISEKMAIEIPYLKELIRADSDNDDNMLTISVVYENKEGAQEILDDILDNLNLIYPEVVKSLGNHKIIIMNQNINPKVDVDLADNQKNRSINLIAMYSKLDEVQKKSDAIMKPQEPLLLSTKSILKTEIKYCLFGAIAGGALSVFVYCMIYIMNQRLCSPEELKYRYGLKIIGTFTYERKKRAFSKIDKLLDKIEGKEYCSEGLVYDRIKANTENCVSKGQTVLLTGTTDEKLLKNIMNKLQEMLPGIHFEMGLDMNKNPETLTKLLKIDGIILIEKCGVSKYNEISKELETIFEVKQKVVGCIVL